MKKGLTLVESALSKLTDEELSSLQFSVPWQYDTGTESYKDADGFPTKTKSNELESREELQQQCWSKFHRNPHINTSVRGTVGRLTGFGFKISSEIWDIQQALDEIEFDPRNRLYNFWPKYVGRSIIEGELHLCLTVHTDGFIEVDFIDPDTISGGNGDGIIFHPNKTIMPLVYNLKRGLTDEQIPSIFIARYPELLAIAKADQDYSEDCIKSSRSSKAKYNKIGGFFRFIVTWDKSFVTKRNISYLRTVLEWLNHYENLKKYEIDHKKSSGSYVWVISIEDPKAFRMWLSLSDEDKRKTGIMAKKTPGSTLILPPGMKLTAINPNLPKISDADTDILHMVTGGLNEPEDVSTGQSKGTFASVKASRGPMADRTSDEIIYFDRFLKYDFYGSLFFLKSAVSNFPSTFKRKEATEFKSKKPIFQYVTRTPEFYLDISYPVSETNDMEGRARALLGVKHASTNETLGIPNSEIVKRLGLGNYKEQRLKHATEEEMYPELVSTEDAESVQEKKIEPKVDKKIKE